MANNLSIFGFVLLAVHFNAVLGSDPPGSNPCTWGPAYWCDSIANAVKCNIPQYCVENDWLNLNAVPCPGCENAIQNIKNHLDSQNIKSIIYKECMAIAHDPNICNGLAHKNNAAFLDVLNSPNISAGAICQISGLCPKTDG